MLDESLFKRVDQLRVDDDCVDGGSQVLVLSLSQTVGEDRDTCIITHHSSSIIIQLLNHCRLQERRQQLFLSCTVEPR